MVDGEEGEDVTQMHWRCTDIGTRGYNEAFKFSVRVKIRRWTHDMGKNLSICLAF